MVWFWFLVVFLLAFVFVLFLEGTLHFCSNFHSLLLVLDLISLKLFFFIVTLKLNNIVTNVSLICVHLLYFSFHLKIATKLPEAEHAEEK